MDQTIERVHGLALFETLDTEWTDEELDLLTTTMTEVNEGARKYFGCYPSEPHGIKVGWTFIKRDSPFGKPFMAWLWTWQSSAVSYETVDELVASLRHYYAWALEGRVAFGGA